MLPQAVQLAVGVLADVDQACSRFRSDSELIRVNSGAGVPTRIGPILHAALRIALEAAAETDGLVDPTLGHALVALGYDRDFALLPAASTDPTQLPRPIRRNSWREIHLDPEPGPIGAAGAILTLPPDCALDLGATGKAWASDLVAHSISQALGADVILSLGGDVCAQGSTSWPVEVSEVLSDPAEPVPIILSSGGLATSTIRGRRWVRGGQQRHHVLDPRTGEPTSGPWRTVSALGHTCAAANTAATAALVLGAEALPWLQQRKVAARLVAADGQVTCTPGWPGESP